MKTNTQRKAYRLLTVALVVAVAFQPMLGAALASTTTASTTSAATPDDDCRNSFGEAFLEALTLRAQPLVDEGECKAQALAANATWVDMFSSGLATNDVKNGALTPIQNRVESGRTVGRTIAKTEAVRLFNNQSNGLNESQIKDEVNASIGNYTSTMQLNVLAAQNSTVNQMMYMYDAWQQNDVKEIAMLQHQKDSTSLIQNVSVNDGGGWAPQYIFKPNGYGAYFNNSTVTLTDGSTATYRVVDVGGTNLTVHESRDYFLSIYVTNPDSYWGYDGGDTDGDPNLANRSNTVEIYDTAQFRYVWVEIETLDDNLKREAAGFVDDLYANYNRSEGVPISEVLNPNDIASQWGTNYNTTGYYGWRAARLGLTGLDGNVSSSFAIEYTPSENHTDTGNLSLNGSGTRDYAFVAGESYNISGTLMTDWEPASTNGSFVRGETYSTANADAPVLFIEQVTSDESRVVRLSGTFTVSTITDVKSGETINSTSLEENNYQTWNATKVSEIRHLIEYRNRSVTINEGESDIRTPSGNLFGNISPLGAGIGGLVGLAVVVVIGKEFAS
jgi:hypothetical protein